MKTLNVDQLAVESFETAPGDTVSNYTLYAGSCGCGTNYDCPSDRPNCTAACIAPSGATDWIACCG
jgi:hypothetical protein